MFYRIDKIRLIKIKAMVLLLFLLLSIRLSYFQYFKRDYFKGLADDQYIYHEKISDINYQLLDIRGKYLNNVVPKYSAVFDARLFKLNNYEANLDNLMALNYIIKEVDESFDVNNILNKSSGKIYINIDEKTHYKIQQIAGKIKGVYSWRYDSLDRTDSWNITNVITNLNSWNDRSKDYNSIEGGLKSLIRDNKAEIKFQVNKSGYIKEAGYKLPNKANVFLTLDSDLQSKIKKILLNEKFNRFSQIGAVLIKAETGEIKAIVQKNDNQPNINIAASLQGYPPGSTFKLLTAELALDKGVISKDEKLTCTGKYCKKNNLSHPHGRINLEQAINYSCNDYFIEIGNKITTDEIIKYAEKNGFLSKILNFNDEASGVLNKPQKDETNNNLVLGYSINATPVQVAAAISPIVNNGKLIKPYIIKKITDLDNNVIKEFTTESSIVTSNKTANTIKSYMRSTVTNGTGTVANISGMDVGGKTGTASSFDGKAMHTHGWFAGYFKKNNEQYILVTFVPNIDGKNELGEEFQGSNTAGVVFKDILLCLK
ncbi:penicillin-binding transpeptidase domain-containing protein [Clostridium polynesiense]|uniref:penicillin-binding transpeptidase domain-containing protein n=1 Tax=Clostridium polynesiense TaxID=1325933 RepID=UPI00058D186D|nr:penicillin-binding transpeptidase domain-containing protein [Clostridium polynesiense]